MDVAGLMSRFAPPPGDAAQVRAAAEQWRVAAGALEALADATGSRVAALGGRWSGPARQAFDGHWRAFAQGLGDGAGELRAAAQVLDRVAAAVDEARARYAQVMAASAATVAAGLLLTPLTLGASDAVAGGVVAGEVGLLLATLAEALGVEAATLAGLTITAARVATAFTAQTGVALGADMASGALLYADHDPFGHLDVAADLELGLIGAAAVPLGALTAAGAARVLPGSALRGAGGRLTSAALDGASFGAADALVRRALDGSVDPAEAVFAALGAGAGSLAVRSLVRPRGEPTGGIPRAGGGPLPEGVASPTGTSQAAGSAGPAEHLPQHLREVFAASTAVPAGRSFFVPKDDPWFARMVQRVPTQPGRAVVFVHGNALGVRSAGLSLSPEELAELVRVDPRLSGRPLTLFACETGRLDDGFAARLARELGVEVVAPTELAWLGPGGDMYTTTGRLVRDGWLQTVPHDGTWRRFRPPIAP